MKNKIILMLFIFIFVICSFTTSFCIDFSLGNFNINNDIFTTENFIYPSWFNKTYKFVVIQRCLDYDTFYFHIVTSDYPFYINEVIDYTYETTISFRNTEEVKDILHIRNSFDKTYTNDLTSFNYDNPNPSNYAYVDFYKQTPSMFSPDGVRSDNIITSYYTNCDIYDTEGNLIISENTDLFNKNPYFITTEEELETGNIEKLVISSGGYQDTEDTIYLQSMYYPEDVSEDESYESLFPVKEIELKGVYSPYYVYTKNGEHIYEIPRADLGIDLIEGNKYAFHLRDNE